MLRRPVYGRFQEFAEDNDDQDVCDGTMWELNIRTNDFSLKSDGHVAFPGNFDTFLHKLEQLTGKIFE